MDVSSIVSRWLTFPMCSTFSRYVIQPFFIKKKKITCLFTLQCLISCYLCTCILCASCTAVTRNPQGFQLKQKMSEVPAASVTVAPILVLCSCFDSTAVLQRHILIITSVQTHKHGISLKSYSSVVLLQ